VPLNISQFYGALHQQAQCGDACEVNKNQTRLLATLNPKTAANLPQTPPRHSLGSRVTGMLAALFH
jgi:hypothetical protein